MQPEKLQVYQDIIDDIVSRTGGNYINMNYTDKLMTITIMKEIKAEMDRYYKEQYPVVKMWASLNIDDIMMSETEPDLTKIRSEEEENFYKLMGGRL